MLLTRFVRRVRRLLPRRDPFAELKSRGLKVGRNLQAQGGVSIDSCHCWHITIGDDVTLAPDVRILAHDASTKRHLGMTRIGKVDIGDRSFIGAGSLILPGVRIGCDVVVGAGSVVTRDLPDGVVACGNPARITGTIAEFRTRRLNELESVPRFGAEYTHHGGVTEEMKAEMNREMADRIGYVL